MLIEDQSNISVKPNVSLYFTDFIRVINNILKIGNGEK